MARDSLRESDVRERLAAIPLARIKDAVQGTLRLAPFERAELSTVLDVLESSPRELQALPGIGARTARQVHGAAERLAATAAKTAGLRIDAERRDAASTALVVALYRLLRVGPDLPRARDVAGLDGRLAPLLHDGRAAWAHRLVTRAEWRRRRRARAAAREVAEILAAHDPDTASMLTRAAAELLREVPVEEAWLDYERRAAEYRTLLAEPGTVDPGTVAPGPDPAEGFLPEGLAARVRAQPLDGAYLRAPLRPYQEFGARFALTRTRVILGDERGLGKTAQAIAVMAHLRTEGPRHFLVACPASGLVNWTREIGERSTLTPYRLHGPAKAAELDRWVRGGGVAVTTLDTLASLGDPKIRLGVLVVDEAHLLKDPASRRAKAVAWWRRRANRVLYLTGAPLENRVAEFRALVAHLRPESLPRIRPGDAVVGSRAFRTAVAPVYLRRDRRDVLAELPEAVHVDEWVEFGAADRAEYRRAVAGGDFTAMRRVAYAVPAGSAKLGRLLELLGEAAEDGRKVVVFSCFREVLAAVREAVPDARGPLDGAMAADRRQAAVDAFAAEAGHGVLLARIGTGGSGLNLQAASVVVICEPQVTPALEAEAVAGAHRLGQALPVRVHRLLTPESVDQRIRELTRPPGGHAPAGRVPDAVDVTEQALARRIVEEERDRLGSA
ncbi:DEAD/DEAH box helicase [Actinomadura roseirufa]|uniref:DEAD/DEAH box helicase n=1 Tax=Actinomadura roseirufa TaxID=2094049 RepID=UPI001F5F6CF5|nr:DEAD/DEAH box helicase [Actinomadura roseirufa]